MKGHWSISYVLFVFRFGWEDSDIYLMAKLCVVFVSFVLVFSSSSSFLTLAICFFWVFASIFWGLSSLTMELAGKSNNQPTSSHQTTRNTQVAKTDSLP